MEHTISWIEDVKIRAVRYGHRYGVKNPCIVTGLREGKPVVFSDWMGSIRWSENFRPERNGGIFLDQDTAQRMLAAVMVIYGAEDKNVTDIEITQITAQEMVKYKPKRLLVRLVRFMHKYIFADN